jgi:hypothetical protein
MTTPIFKHQAHRQNTSSRNYWYRDGDERFYKRIWAGIRPPSERPGAVIICAEELSLRPPAHIYWIDEAQESATDNLMQRSLDFKALYQVQEFYGRTKDKDFCRFLSFWNANRREKNLKTIEISSAPNSAEGKISFHIGVLRNRLSPASKTLHLSDSKLLPAAFQELQMSAVSGATDSEFPVLAALGYVVAALDSYGAHWERDEPEFGITEYDLFADRDDYSINS